MIDEIQMVKDYQRGWAWTRALLGVAAKEVHVCGEVSYNLQVSNALFTVEVPIAFLHLECSN